MMKISSLLGGFLLPLLSLLPDDVSTQVTGILSLLPDDVSAQVTGILGAGTGEGSCSAYPYRAGEVQWEICPAEYSCCTEFGYCRPRVED